jgi:hypothetical protein
MIHIRSNQNGFSLGQIVLVVLTLGLIGAIGFYVFQKQNQPEITNFTECKAAGNQIMESYPERCLANGQTFTNTTQKIEKKSLGINEIDVTLPLGSEVAGAYYTVRSPQSDPTETYIELFDADFDALKNGEGTTCKDSSFPLFVIGRISVSDYNKKVAEGAEENSVFLNFDEPFSFNSEYRYTGGAAVQSPPSCAFDSAGSENRDQKVLEVFNAKKKAFTEAYKNMQDL